MTAPEQDRIAEVVISILARHALRPPGEIQPDQRIEDLGLDSMAMVEAVFAIEEAFDILVPFNPQAEEGAGFDTETVAGLIRGVRGLIAEGTAI